MTIPSGDNYCPSCEEVCHDHPSICTVCGTTLVAPPAPSNSNNSDNTTTTPRVRVVPEHLVDEIRTSTRALADLLRNINEQVESTRQTQQELMESLQGIRREIMEQGAAIPAALLDPSNTPAAHRPTAQKTLQDLPRIQLESHNSLFYQVTLSFLLEGQQRVNTMEGVLGEFGSGNKTCLLEQAVLVAAEPRTGKGGKLSLETVQKLAELQKVDDSAVIVYMERGDGVTFVQKALLAQKHGAQAVIIGNNLASPWPYVMRDSKREAEKLGLTIPVVMVKQQDGRSILSQTSANSPLACCLRIQEQPSKDCVICTDTFSVGQTVLRLPACGHVFHDACALRWLERHNTCPYCRRELPTDDADYEQERRRTQRTHAGSEVTANSGWSTFYG